MEILLVVVAVNWFLVRAAILVVFLHENAPDFRKHFNFQDNNQTKEPWLTFKNSIACLEMQCVHLFLHMQRPF